MRITPLFLAYRILLIVGLCSGLIHADSLVINNLSYADVKIQTIENEHIYFVTSTGNHVHKPLAEVTKINVADEPTFNAAEEAYKARDWSKATDGYDKTMRSTQKPWLGEWASGRLLDSANRSGRFDQAVSAYITVAERSPAAVKNVNLTLPKANSAYLTDGAALLNSAIDKSKNEQTRVLLLKLLIDVYNAKGDSRAAESVLERLVRANANLNPNSSEAHRAQAMLKLKSLRTLLESKEYDKVIVSVEKDGSLFSELSDQVEALLCYADAKAGKFAASKDEDAAKEVSIAYMRVVAHSPASAQAATALFRVASIHETKLNEKATAVKIYQQIAADFAGQEFARQAEQEIKRLSGG
jgi:hypothetical protein